MTSVPIALWIIGPCGSGKSTLIDKQLPSQFLRIEQDPELEAALLSAGLPLDMRWSSAEQLATIAKLRMAIADRVWSQVPVWRSRQLSMTFAVTGNKPHLLRDEVERGRAASYVNLGVGLRCPLATCLVQNAMRRRVVPDALVEGTWHDFELNLTAGVYDAIFGARRFCCVRDPEQFDLRQWLREQIPDGQPD